jgi:deoxyhypusine synthase
MGAREFHDGAKDGFEALEPLNPEAIHSFDDLLVAMRKTAFGGRRLGEAYEVLWAMIEDSFRCHDHREDGQDHQHHD